MLCIFRSSKKRELAFIEFNHFVNPYYVFSIYRALIIETSFSSGVIIASSLMTSCSFYAISEVKETARVATRDMRDAQLKANKEKGKVSIFCR